MGANQYFENQTLGALSHDYQFPPAGRQPIGGDLKNEADYLLDTMAYYGSGYISRASHKRLLSTNTMFADGHVKSSAWKGAWQMRCNAGYEMSTSIAFNR